MFRIALIVLVVVAGCGKREAEEPNPARDDPQVLAAKVRDALRDMVEAAEAHPEDCKGMAQALTVVFDDVRPLFDHVQALSKQPGKEKELATAFEPHATEAQALSTRLSRAINPCQGDPTFGDAISKMPVLD